MSAGYSSLALKADGTIWASGRNDGGQLGDGTTSYRTSFVQGKTSSTTYLTNVKKIFSAPLHSLAITNDGKLFVCGTNAYGQLGTGLKVNKPYWTEVTTLLGLTNFQVLDIGGGERGSMILVKDLDTNQNKLFGAGRNEYGELGLGDNVEHITWTLSPLSDVVDLESAWWHNAAIVKNSTDNYVVYATGNGGSGRSGIGDGTNKNLWTPTILDNVREIYAGLNNMIAVCNDNTVWGTGSNGYGQLNLGDLTNRIMWTQTRFTDITEVSIGASDHLLYLKRNGDLLFIGNVMSGQNGDGKNHYQNIPAQTNLTGSTSLGNSIYGSFALKNGYIYAAGYNGYSGLGLNDGFNRDRFSQTPLNNVAKVTGGDSYVSYLKNDGTVWSAGYNGYGQLGNGTVTSTGIAQQAKIDASNYLTGVVDISATRLHTLALKSDGTVWGAGYNAYCQVSTGVGCTITGANQTYFVQIASGASKVSAGYGFSAVLKTDGTLITIGENTSGQLGNGNMTNQATWQASTTGVLEMWGGVQNTFVRKADGIYAVGYNGYGQLGIGNTSNKSTWTKITALDGLNIRSISQGNGHTYALKTDGTALSVGYNYYGQLGQGDFVRDSVWTQISLTGIEEISNSWYATVFRKNDGTVWSVGYDSHGNLALGLLPFEYSFSTILEGVKQPAPFITTGSITGFKIDGGSVSKWVSVIWDATVPAGTTLKIRTRGSATEADLTNAAWGDWKTASGDSPGLSNSQWLELEVSLESSDGAFSPILNSLTAIYYTDVEAPTNPTTVSAWNSPEKLVALADTVWQKNNDLYLEWSGDADIGESGVKGYWVYFGTDPTADPRTAGSFQTTPSISRNIPDTDSGKTYYLCISTEDFAQNRYLNESGFYYKTFTYRFDKTAPEAPSYVAVTPAGWTTQNNFSFTWPAATDITVNGDSSGVVGYQYKREGGGDDWSSLITDLSVVNITSYQSGQNIFSVRAVDLAGNYSTPTQVNYYYNADAPTKPTNLRVAPQSSDQNAFTFDWDAPAFANGGVKGYYYSINATPNAKNTVFTTSTTTGEIAAATQQSFNTFYVVASDITDNINWGSYESIQFECNTSAPGIPLNPELFDTSNRDIPKYSVAVNWAEPTYKGVGFKEYVVERSLDASTFSNVGTSSGTSYIDTNLESKPYYYRIMARDNSGNISAPSEMVSVTPTGRYTSAPAITVQPETTVKVSTASIRWVTDRGASSFVEIGENVQYGLTQGQFDFVTDHKVALAGLKPNTIYHYRVKFVDEDGNIGYSEDKTLQTEPAPRVERVTINDVRLYTAVLTWYTSEPAESNLLYGRGTGYGSEIKNVSGGATTVHSVRLEGLEHSSTYHFAVRIKDIDGNEILSDDYSFETQKFPVISLVRMESVKDKASATTRVTWQTNVPTNSVVEYTPTGGSTQEVVKTKLETSHDVMVTGLIDNTYYRLVAKSTDQYGNTATSDAQNYKTDFDTRPPVLSSLSYEVSSSGYGVDAKTQVVVYWESDEPGTSQVEYGIGLSGDYTSKSMEDASLGTSHVVVISDLKPSTSYHFRAVSRDGSRNEGFTDDTAILTEQARSSIIDVVFQTLQNALGWMFGA